MGGRCMHVWVDEWGVDGQWKWMMDWWWMMDRWTVDGWSVNGWSVDGCWTVDRLMMDGLWRDGQMSWWMDGQWKEGRESERFFLFPFPCILPSRRPSLTLSPGGEQLSHLPCAVEAQTPNQSWVSPLLFLVLFLLPASLTGFPSCIPAPSYPLILRLLVFLTISLPCFRLYCFPLSILNLGEGHPCSSPSTLAYSGLTSWHASRSPTHGTTGAAGRSPSAPLTRWHHLTCRAACSQ